jgi:Concanavalin A-like lectin/glucanases superfamily
VFGNAQLPLNTRQHIATTYDGARLRLYVNGLQVGSRCLPGSVRTSGGPRRIGGNSVWGEHFQGSTDEVHIYNCALLASEIQADMNTAIVATTSGVLSVQNSGVPQNLGGILSALGKSTPPLGSAGPQTANGASRSSASTTTTTTSDLLTSDHVMVGMAVTGRPTLISEKGLQFQLQPQGLSPGLGALQTVSYVVWELSMAPLTTSPSRSTKRSTSRRGSLLSSYLLRFRYKLSDVP